MANHKSSLKRIRQTEAHNEHNHYYGKTTRNLLKEVRETKDKSKALEMLPKISAMLDKLAKINVIHKNKASNLKSSVAKHINSLA